MRPLVILRPQPGGDASVAAAGKLGLDALAIPLFRTEPVKWGPVDPERYSGIVATSANAFRHAGPQLAALRGLPVHAVGEATADAARASGFQVASIGQGGREQLQLPAGPLLHLAGRDHLPIGDAVETMVVYASRAVEPRPALDRVAGAVVAVHSPRAGRRLAELVQDRGSTAIAAISANAAEACGEGWLQVAVASEPREAALLALAAELCQNAWRR